MPLYRSTTLFVEDLINFLTFSLNTTSFVYDVTYNQQWVYRSLRMLRFKFSNGRHRTKSISGHTCEAFVLETISRICHVRRIQEWFFWTKWIQSLARPRWEMEQGGGMLYRTSLFIKTYFVILTNMIKKKTSSGGVISNILQEL